MNGKSDTIKAVVELTKPIFVDVKWKDINGNNILEIGKRETVFANIQLEGVIGLDLQYDLCSLATDKIFQTDKLKMTSTKAVVCVKLFDQVCKELKEGNKLYYKISCKDTSIVIGNKTKPSKEFPITYTKKEKISAFAFYTDKSCKEIVTIASYGSTIYARVLTRNLTGESLEVFIYRKTPRFFYGTNNIELSKSESKVDGEGIAIFEIKISNDWKNKGNDSYVLAVTEKGDPFYKEKGLSNWETNDTAQKEFTIGKDLLFMRFIDEPISDNDGKVLTKIGKAKTSNRKSKCERCKDFTEGNFEKIFPNVKKLFELGTNSLSKTTLKDFADELNKAFNEFEVDNCNRKLHFLTQVACETGDFQRIDENLSYTGTKFQNANWPQKTHPKLYETGAQAKFANNAEALANYVYRDHDGNEGEESGDGYKYRGRGLIQLTKKGCYQRFENYLVDKDKVDKGTIVNNPDLLVSNLSYMVRSAVWYWKYGKTSTGTDSRLDMSPLADKGNISKITLWVHGSTNTIDTRISKYEKLKNGFELSKCNFYMNNLAKDYSIDYHVYSDGSFVKYVPKGIEESEIFQYRYYYHDMENTEHFVAETIAIQSKKYDFGKKVNPGGTVVTRNGSDSKPRYYKLLDGTILLVRLPEGLDKRFGKTIIKYTDNTVRNFCDPQVFASLIGALAECSYEEIVFNGCTCWEGIGNPSVSHAQGFNTDFRYIRSDGKTNIPINIATPQFSDMQKDRQNSFNKALKNFGWAERLSNTVNIKLEEVKHDASHGDHLHNQKYSIEIETKQK